MEFDPPRSWYELLFRMDVTGGCGDLIFSGHVSISLSVLISLYLYGMYLYPKIVYWVFISLTSCSYILMMLLIIASRKHYTVDVFIALYTTPLVYHASYLVFPDVEGDPGSKHHGTYRQKSGGVRLQMIEQDISLLFPLPRDTYYD